MQPSNLPKVASNATADTRNEGDSSLKATITEYTESRLRILSAKLPRLGHGKASIAPQRRKRALSDVFVFLFGLLFNFRVLQANMYLFSSSARASQPRSEGVCGRSSAGQSRSASAS